VQRALNKLGPIASLVVGVVLILAVAGLIYLIATTVPDLTEIAHGRVVQLLQARR
jgi:hypothetical protein